MNAADVVNQLALSIIAGCFILNFWLLFFVYNRSIMNENRIDILDRVASAVTDADFDSKAISAGDQPLPPTTRIRRVFAKVLNGTH
jgi:hypothetical protein